MKSRLKVHLYKLAVEACDFRNQVSQLESLEHTIGFWKTSSVNASSASKRLEAFYALGLAT